MGLLPAVLALVEVKAVATLRQELTYGSGGPGDLLDIYGHSMVLSGAPLKQLSMTAAIPGAGISRVELAQRLGRKCALVVDALPLGFD